MRVVKRVRGHVLMTMKESVGVARKTTMICRSPGWIGIYFPYLLEFALCTSPVLFRVKS